MADITDFQLGQGESFKLFVRILDRGNSNTPVDITHYSFTGQVRENYTSDEVAANLTFIKTLPYTSGSFYVYMSPDTTMQLNQRKYVYDVRVDTSGSIRRLLEGGLTVRPAVTR
jgi:hypothetical protein